MEKSSLETTLILVRHGETAFNQEGRYQGQQDIPLNDVGRAQAQDVKARLAQESYQFLWSSDLSRAKETAEIIRGDSPITLHIDPRFREISFGHWEGHSSQVIAEQWPAEVKQWREQPQIARIPGGETLREVHQRLQDGLKSIVEHHQGEKGVLVLHGGPIHVLGLDFIHRYRIPIDNGGISVIKKQVDQWVLRSVNDVAHLSQKGTINNYEV